MLFKVKDGVDIFELNDGLKAIKEFDITPRQMTLVALYADSESPFRTHPDRARREQIGKAVGLPMEADGKRLDKNGRDFVDGKILAIEKAILKYKEIQYDETTAILEAYDRQIQEAIELMKMDKVKAAGTDDPGLAFKLADQAIKLGAQLPVIKEAKKKILELMNAKDNTPELKNYITPEDVQQAGSENLSTLDQVMAAKQAKQ